MAIERNLHDRVSKLETTMERVIESVNKLERAIQDLRAHIDSRFDSWLRWILGFMFTSWLSIMVSIWLKG